MDELFEIEHVCSNPECRVSETGKCMEGFELDKCSFYGQQANLEDIPELEHGQLGESEDYDVMFSDGNCVSVEEASRILKKCNPRVISFIGNVFSGKTTLIASLYEKFLTDPHGFAGLIFARSYSLHAFEKACHYVRTTSCSDKPHSERTSLTFDVQFYHFDLLDVDSKEVITFLLADRAGETYLSFADSPEIADTCVEIHRSDCIVMLVDGHKICDSKLRHTVEMESRWILQGLIEREVIGKNQNFAIVLTKYDVIYCRDSCEREEINSFFEKLVSSLEGLCRDYVNSVVSFKTAASPSSGSLSKGYGLEDLFTFMKRNKPSLNIQAGVEKKLKRVIDWIK